MTITQCLRVVRPEVIGWQSVTSIPRCQMNNPGIRFGRCKHVLTPRTSSANVQPVSPSDGGNRRPPSASAPHVRPSPALEVWPPVITLRRETMTTTADSPSSADLYVEGTRRRMARAIGHLAAIRRVGSGDLSEAAAELREQADASRLAGFRPISQLCQTVERYLLLEACLARASPTRRARVTGIAAVLLNVCHAIDLHAEAVAKTLVCLGSHDVSPMLSRQLERQLPC